MFMFRRELGVAAEALRSGDNVQIRSQHRGLGLTSVLAHLERLLTAEGFTVFRFGGTLSAAPDFFSLQLAGFAQAAPRTPHPDGALVDELAGALSASARTVVLIDRLPNVDPASTRILEAALARTRARIVEGRDRDHWSLRRSGVRWMPRADVVLPLEPLGYIDVAALLQDTLGAPLSAEVISRVFAASGGITGLALTLARTARTFGRITQRAGRWELDAHDLLPGAVEAWFEDTLSGLSIAHIRVLRSVAESRAFDETDLLDDLIGRGFLVRPTGDPRHLALAPPALATYLLGPGMAALSPPSAAADPISHTYGETTVSTMDTARTVRTYKERAEKLLLEHRRRWLEDPGPDTALPYLSSLTASPRTERAIEEVYENTRITGTSSSTAAFDFAVFARLRQDSSGKALSAQTVERVRDLFPEWLPVLGVMLVFSQTGQVPVGDIAKARLAPSDDDRAAMILALDAYAQLGTGHVTRARSALRRAETSSVTAQRFFRFVAPLMPLLRGDALDAREGAQRALRNAIESVDYHGILLHSYLCIATSLWQRNLSDALRYVDQALAFGAPGGSTASVYRGILLLASLTNALLGKRETARAFATEADLIDAPPPPLPGMHPRLSLAIAALADDRADDAAALARDIASDLFAAGQRFPAMATLMYCLSLHPDRQTLGEIRRVASFPNGHALRPPSWVAVVAATFESVGAFTEATRRLGQGGPSPLLLCALQHRRERDELRDTPIGDAIGIYLDDIARMPGHGDVADTDIPADDLVFTGREREIGLLAAGASNKEIADGLGISVRTVESHIRSAMKKAGVRDRGHLTRVVSTAPLGR